MRGVFDLPAPLLHGANEFITGWIPPSVAIALWASVGAIVCMELYRLFSPQQRIDKIKHDATAAQQQLANYDGAMEGALPLMKSMLKLSLLRVGIVLPATLLSAYPILALIIWMSNEYDYRFPVAGESVQVEVSPPHNATGLSAVWVPASGDRSPLVRITQPQDDAIMEVPVKAPIPTLHKPMWWNVLVGNPAGYLPPTAPVEEINLHLPKQVIINGGPLWARGWEIIFFPVLFIVSFSYKILRRIH